MDKEYVTLQFLSGFKTLIAGGFLLGSGVFGLYSGKLDAESSVGMIGAGLGIWGIGGKIEKTNQALRSKGR